MPKAICNMCGDFVFYKGRLKDKVCKCGSKKLSQVRGQMNEIKMTWDYYNRKGELVKVVPV